MGLYDVLKSITVTNWYCGEISALYAWSNNCTIEQAKDKAKIRRALAKIGYKAHFGRGILNVERVNTINNV